MDVLFAHRGSQSRSSRTLRADVRELEHAAREGIKHAELALEVFAYRARKYIGAFAAALGGVDAVASTGGIGEHSGSLRSRICQGLGFLGLRLEDKLNESAKGDTAMRVSAASDTVQIWVIPTDEERQIARSAYQQLHG